METNIAVAQFGSVAALANLPENIIKGFAELANDTFAGVSNGNMRFIRMNGMQFNLVEGKEITTIDKLVCVLLGAANCNHALWYKRSYSQSAPAEGPDLVWKRPTDDVFPDALPQEFRHKIDIQGQKKWAFQIKRRTVWAIIRPDASGNMFIDFDNPYILDIPSMSLYGASRVEMNEYKWGSLGSLCQKMSTQGVVVYPSMFPIQICADPTIRGNNGVMVFKPMRNPDNGLAFLDAQTIMKVFAITQSNEIKDLCDVKEKLTLDENPAPVPTSVAPVTPQPQPQPVAQPQPQPVAQPQPQPQPVAQPQPQPQSVAQPQPASSNIRMDTANLLAQAQSFLAGTGAALQQPAAQQAAAQKSSNSAQTQANNIESMLAALR